MTIQLNDEGGFIFHSLFDSLRFRHVDDCFFSSNCKGRVAPTNLNPSDPSNHNNRTKSSVTVTREIESKLIVNEIPLCSDEIEHFNVHDYAFFVQENLLLQWWFNTLRQRPMKLNNTLHSSTKLWAKVRAVTYLTTLAHRTGSWYSDDRTERSPNDESSSLSESEEQIDPPKIEFYDVNSPYITSEPTVPLRRSYSSIDNSKYHEQPSLRLPRSLSTVLIHSPDHTMDISPSNPPIPKPSPPPTPPPIRPSSSRVYRFLHCILL